jgi:hypothetical protein
MNLTERFANPFAIIVNLSRLEINGSSNFDLYFFNQSYLGLWNINGWPQDGSVNYFDIYFNATDFVTNDKGLLLTANNLITANINASLVTVSSGAESGIKSVISGTTINQICSFWAATDGSCLSGYLTLTFEQLENISPPPSIPYAVKVFYGLIALIAILGAIFLLREKNIRRRIFR